MSASKQQLQQDIALWYADGLIEQQTYSLLQQRYAEHSFGLAGVVKYLGIMGGFFALAGLLGMIAAFAESKPLMVLILLASSVLLIGWGLRLADDVAKRYTTSSKFIVTIGVWLWASWLGVLFGGVMDLEEGTVILLAGLFTLPFSLILAYQRHNTYLLILSLLALFHWVGSWSSMFGRASYVFSVQDPYVMCIFSVLVFAIGWQHQIKLYPSTGRFYQAWQSLGLLYLNMSLLILSIWHHQHHSGIALWTIIFTFATIAQIVFGARFHSGLLRGFGISFFAINLFTRYHEAFWDSLAIGTFLTFGGLLLVAVGAGFEWANKWLNNSFNKTSGEAA